jgi:hypothetical protein
MWITCMKFTFHPHLRNEKYGLTLRLKDFGRWKLSSVKKFLYNFRPNQEQLQTIAPLTGIKPAALRFRYSALTIRDSPFQGRHTNLYERDL